MRIEYNKTDRELFAVDGNRNVVVLDTDGWNERTIVYHPEQLTAADADPTDYTHGEIEGFRGPPVHVVSVNTETGERQKLAGPGSLEFDDDTVVQLCSTVRVAFRARDGGRLERRPDETAVTFDGRTGVTFGWASRVDYPEHTVSVPRSVDGVARYLTVASGVIADTTPDRTWPNIRDHPPRLQFGDEQIPEELESERPETGIRLLVPRENGLQTVLPLAPLVHYLGAEVVVSPGTEPTLDLDGDAWWLGRSAEEADRQASLLLKRVFYLDCLARAAGPYGEELPQQPVIRELGLDADNLYEMPLVGRVRRYLDTSFEDVANEFPDWHLGVHVDPTYEQLSAVPSHLNRLADIYCPESAQLTLAEQMAWSLDNAFSRGDSEPEEPTVVDPADRAQTVGWAGPHVAVGAFNYFPEVFDNKSAYVDAEDSLSVVVVNNSAGMFEEHQQVIQNYNERVEDMPIMELDVHSMLDPEALAEVFEAGADLVHYIGHCDDRGLKCPEGRFLHTASLRESRAETFFLNACGSFDQGRELIRRGSVAGAVTRVESSNLRATQVGNDWSRLMANGWSAERGLDVARRVTDSPGNYVLIGDGPHTLTPSDAYVPVEIRAEKESDREFRVTVDKAGPRSIGSESKLWADKFSTCIEGGIREFSISTQGLRREYNEIDSDSPIVMDNALIWNSENIE